MKILNQSVLRFLKREDGPTAVECALLLAVVVAICLVVLRPDSLLTPRAEAEPIMVAEVETNG